MALVRRISKARRAAKVYILGRGGSLGMAIISQLFLTNVDRYEELTGR
jgi:hypothetical protein